MDPLVGIVGNIVGVLIAVGIYILFLRARDRDSAVVGVTCVKCGREYSVRVPDGIPVWLELGARGWDMRHNLFTGYTVRICKKCVKKGRK